MQDSRRPWGGVLKLLAASLLATLLVGAFTAMSTVQAQVPPDLEPPDLALPDLEPPEDFPPDLAPPEGFPPDLAPPEGFPSGDSLPISPDALSVSPDALPAPPGDGLPVSADALPAPPGDGLPVSPDALPAPPGDGLPVSPDALPIPTDGSMPGTTPDAEADAEVTVGDVDEADEAAPDAVAGTGPAGLPAAGGGMRGNLDNWSAAAGITLLAVAGSLLTVGARMRGMI